MEEHESEQLLVRREPLLSQSSTLRQDNPPLQNKSDFEIPTKKDSCLLCGHSHAVGYDSDGTVIKREPLQLEYSYKELFSNLCHLLSENNNKLDKAWDFNSDPFPFCEGCESRMVTLSDLYGKLRELEEIVREEMRRAEVIYKKEGLYTKHKVRYFIFRKTLLGEKFKVVKKSSVGSVTSHNDGQGEGGSSKKGEASSQTRHTVRQRERKTSQPEEGPSRPSGTRIVRVLKLIPKENGIQIGKGHPQAKKHYPNLLLTNTKTTKKMLLKVNKITDQPRTLARTNAKSKRRALEISRKKPMPSRKEEINNLSKTDLLFIKRGRCLAGMCSICGMPFEGMTGCVIRRHGLTHMNDEDKQLYLESTSALHKAQVLKDIAYTQKKEEEIAKKNELKAKKAAKTPKNTSRTTKTARNKKNFNNGFIKVDKSTGNVIYETGFKTGFTHSDRFIFHFTKLSEDVVNKTCTYRCDSCSEMICQKTKNSLKQRHMFRSHAKAFHSDLLKCRLCPQGDSSIQFRTSVEFLSHLKGVHNMNNRAEMNVAYHNNRKLTLGSRLSITANKCIICGMPKPKTMSRSEFRNHQFTHMSDEDKKKMIFPLSVESKRVGVLRLHREVLPDGLRETMELCEICGKYYARGTVIVAHRKTHLPDSERQKLCSICGAGFLTKVSLDKHVQRFHPDGKLEASKPCKFPECEWIFEQTMSLEEHVDLAHGNSELKGVLCKLCGKVLLNSWTLKQHGLVHSGKKSFQCQSCSKSFSLKDTLTRHMAAVHRQGDGVGVFKCEAEGCMEVFPCKSYLTCHMRRHHNIFRGYTKKSTTGNNK